MDEQDKKRGLYPRYHITKTSGKPVDSHAEYFVLRLDEEGGDPEHVQACRAAIITYAKRIKNTIPHLARDLMEKYDKWTTEPWPKIVDVERLDPSPDSCMSSFSISSSKKSRVRPFNALGTMYSRASNRPADRVPLQCNRASIMMFINVSLSLICYPYSLSQGLTRPDYM